MRMNNAQPKSTITFPDPLDPPSDYGMVSKDCEYIFHNAVEDVRTCNNISLRGRASDFLSILKNHVVDEIANDRLLPDGLPVLLSDISDSECFFGWVFAHMRIGFSISLNDCDSGFFVISDEQYGELDISRPFDSTESIVDIMQYIETYDNDRSSKASDSRIGQRK